MIRKIVLGSVAAAAFAVGGLTSTAHAQIAPTYTCDNVRLGLLRQGLGFGNCVPSPDATAYGPYFGRSILISRIPGEPSLFCQLGGFARTPASVTANGCS
jgi:hypothetical protein